MKNRLKRGVSRFVTLLFVLLISAVAISALLIFLTVALIVTVITSIPKWAGQLVPMDELLRRVLFTIFNEQRMLAFREDLIKLMMRNTEVNQDYDRYFMLREMENAAERINTNLRSGELVIAVLAAIVSISLSFLNMLPAAAVVLTVFTIGISVAAFFRLVITDVLAHDAALYREAGYNEIALRMGWNRGPINGRGAILLSLGTLVAGSHELGYRWGLEMVESYARRKHYNDDSRWKAGE